MLSEHPVSVALPPDLPLVNVDPVLIEQVFANLLENVVKYTPRGTPVEISARKIGPRIAVDVADSGPGIPPGEEAKLFDKFYRLQREAPQSGVGLGLAICKAIIAAHGGTISAANRPAGGAVFRFELPAGEPPTVEAESVPAAPAQTAS
jgi:two-component system sensor histidine kinase KdpD